MITVTSLELSIAGRALVRDASFVVTRGDKAAIVGRNGVGKSSLLSVLVGEPSAQLSHKGDVQVVGTLGYLPQVPVSGGLGTDASALSHVLSSRSLDALDVELVAARRAMAADPTSERISHFSEIEERYRTLGGYEAESTVARMADGLGLRQDLLLSDVDSLSGGQRRRLDLMRVLFAEPDVMVLDEPTNHLDAPAKRWLMDQLAQFKGALLLVSHDLSLLDRAITKVLHLHAGVLEEYAGTYGSFRAQLSQRLAHQERLAVRQAREVARLTAVADSMRASTAKRARIAKTIDKRVDRLERSRTPTVKKERRVRFVLPDPPRSGDTPLEVNSLAVSYGTQRVLCNVSLALARGDRVAVVGRNGAGKSSLLRCLSGVQVPSKGAITWGHNVMVGYFAQEHEQVDPERSALENIDDSVLRTEVERRSLLGSFGLTGELATRRAGSLSGGERAKLSLAMLAAGWCNLLVLDEPTNNLDPQSVTAVGEMLRAWPGTLVVVSHDRAFIEALTPTHGLLLPSERFDFWRESYLDQVELR
jgi:ATPase subunit of ABC transporter with duplicated ATPase domains